MRAAAAFSNVAVPGPFNCFHAVTSLPVRGSPSSLTLPNKLNRSPTDAVTDKVAATAPEPAADGPLPLWKPGSGTDSSEEDAAIIRDTLFGPGSGGPAPRPVTLEELFGTTDDPKGSAKP